MLDILVGAPSGAIQSRLKAAPTGHSCYSYISCRGAPLKQNNLQQPIDDFSLLLRENISMLTGG
jgi:hypothetical protein